ncbi:MAG TPA: MCP four helix bundle domain-containing protein, partial [Opitutus sp.]|nr:MCP four helix bundle domain-containing protein [Opitutus sp.]
MKLLRSSKNFSFRQTILTVTVCFALVAIGVGALAFVSGGYTRQGSRQTETLTSQFLPGLVSLTRLQDGALNLKSITLQFALARDEAGMNAQKQAFVVETEAVSQSLAQLESLSTDDQSKALIADLGTSLTAYREVGEKFQTELRGGDFEKAMATLDQQVAPAQQLVETNLDKLSEQYFARSK